MSSIYSKVETIGDAYMVASGLLETSKNHGYAVTKFSFFMRDAAQSIKRPTDDTCLRVREACLNLIDNNNNI